MNPFFQTIIIAYLFFVVPILMGSVETAVFSKEKKSVSEIVTNGYLVMFAMFFSLAVILIQKEQPLSALSRSWGMVVVVITLMGIIIGQKVLKQIVLECRKFWQKGKGILLLVVVVSIVGSVGFVKPSIEDATVLIVETSIETDSMYLVNPYSGYETGVLDSSGAYSPLEMLYATGIQFVSADSQLVIYYILPVIQLVMFFVTVWRMSGILLEQEEQRIWFEVVMIAIYWMTTYMKKQGLVTGIFLNSWNGLTVLSCIILPLAFTMLIKWIQQAEYGIKSIPAKLEKCVLTIMLIFAAQLTNNNGGFYIFLMLFLAIAVVVVKGGYAYGIKTGRFKKCI